jgi:hypothetical protein
MNKTLIIFLFAGFFCSKIFGQIDSLEKVAIYNKLSSKEIEQDEFLKIWLRWSQVMKEIKQYPNLPLDQNGQVHYSFTNKFTDYNKEKLFNRTLEWLTINYGLIPSYIYSNLEDGKIIFKNSLNIETGGTCNFTSVISIKNEKMMIEFISIAYQTIYQAHYKGDMWMPERTVNLNINQVYPIVLKDPSEWDKNLKMFKLTNELFNTETKNLYDYITSYDSSYMF